MNNIRRILSRMDEIELLLETTIDECKRNSLIAKWNKLHVMKARELKAQNRKNA